MKNFKIILVLFFCFLSQAKAQRLINSVGISFSTVFGSLTNKQGYKNDLMLNQYYITYAPRFNFVEMNNASFSIDAPLGIIFAGYSGTYTVDNYGFTSGTSYDSGFMFGYVVPVLIDFNIGSKSTSDNFNHAGAFIGAGYDYEHFSIFGTKYSNTAGNILGPIFRGGYRWCVAQNNGISISAFYKQGKNKDKLQTIGIALLADI